MSHIRVGFTHGDINGIGLEMLIKTLSQPEMLELCTPVVFSEQSYFDITVKALDLEEHLNYEAVTSVEEVRTGCLNIVNVCEPANSIEWGKQTEHALMAEAASLNAALKAYASGKIDVLLCCPGQLNNDLDHHHLSDFIRQALGVQKEEFDWIINGNLRLLKLHSIDFTTELGEGIAIEAFMNDLMAISMQLRQDFGFIRPRIAVLSQNQKLLADIKELRENNVLVFGPFDAKSFIEAGNHTHYDAVLFLEEEDSRHELIASLTQEDTIGYVSGLPVILTYSLLPVSYDVSGKNMTDCSTMRQALYSAIDIYRNRRRYAEAVSHPLEKQWIPKGRDDFKLDLTSADE